MCKVLKRRKKKDFRPQFKKRKKCHIQRKTVSILLILHVYSHLAPHCQKKSEISQPRLPPCQKKPRHLIAPFLPFHYKFELNWLPPPPLGGWHKMWTAPSVYLCVFFSAEDITTSKEEEILGSKVLMLEKTIFFVLKGLAVWSLSRNQFKPVWADTVKITLHGN